jgi:putative membrane-bound dehydrogenase-like protein
MRSIQLLLVIVLLNLTCATFVVGQQPWQVGVAKVNITPTEPLRLSGYAAREAPSEGVADELNVRVLVLRHAESRNATDSETSAKPLVLVSIDAIAIPGPMTVQVAQWLQATHGIPRSHLVLSCTHSHAAPHLPGVVDNLFRESMSDEQSAASDRYLKKVIEAVKQSVDKALATMQPAKIEIREGTADFGVNRRVVKEGRWINFGVQPDGTVDHKVRVLSVTVGGKLIGGAFQYACHCTTMGPEFNQVSGDWAGLSAAKLESDHSNAVFLPIMGCGADINPNPRGSYDLAKQHASTMASAVSQALKSKEAADLPASSAIQFGFAGLEPELPEAVKLDETANSQDPNVQRWGQRMLAIKKAMGRLPESVPMPIHVWSFGDRLTWVFLSGEPVVDYQYILEKEFSTASTWVAGYCNDVFAYLASEQQRAEGGYEVDESMIYFLQPGRWKSGTQSVVSTRTSQIGRQTRGDDEPLDPSRALKALHATDGYKVDMLASEPMIQDPVNISFGMDGTVWVVEMSDYPLGVPGGGRVKSLRDTNGDGKLDISSTFLEGLSYPTSVHPWRKGVLVIEAPNVLYAEDTNGDGVADSRKVLLSGIEEANPQHRGCGFEIGLDGRLHFAPGHGTQELHSLVNGQKYKVHERDVAWNPDTGDIEVFVNDKTQFIPARDSFSNWFGNNNYQPMYQFVYESNELAGQSVETGSIKHLLTPGDAPPVFPRSRTVDRFNDMYTRERYTSACGSMIVRVPGMFPTNHKHDSNQPVALICEPVHNLVARVQLQPNGSVFSAVRHPQDVQFDFLASSDPWARMVRAVNSPDGSIWVLDMYRRVIEHPEWIPTAWQQRIDIRSGAGLGRIYRVYHGDFSPQALKDLRQSDPVKLLQSSNGAIRDMVTQAIVTDQFDKPADELQKQLRQLVGSGSAEVQASVLGVLAGKKWLLPEDLIATLNTASDPQLVRWCLKLAGRFFEEPSESLKQAVSKVPGKALGRNVDLQWLLTVHRWKNFTTAPGIAEVLSHGQPDPWLSAALNLANTAESAEPVLRILLEVADANASSANNLQEQLSTAKRLVKLLTAETREKVVANLLVKTAQQGWTAGRVLLLAATRDELDAENGKRLHEQQLKLAENALLSGSVDSAGDESKKFLPLLLGNQLIPRERELEVMTKLLDQGGSVASLVVQRARFVKADEVAELLLKSWAKLRPDDQTAAAGTLMTRPAWRTQLVQALERGEVNASQLPAAVIQTMISMEDRNLRSRAIKVFGQPSPRSSIVSDYLKKMPNPNAAGDAANGEKVFKEHCAVCHTQQNGKASVGPAIDNLGHWTNEQWIAGVMDPNQVIEDKFKQTTILTIDQQVLSGIIVETSATAIKLVGPDGNRREIVMTDIEDQKRSNVSLMPEGFEAKVTPQQLADIVKYLRTK